MASAAAAFISWVALAGALVSFVAGAVYAARALKGARATRWFAVVAWPFLLARLKTAAGEHAQSLDRALVAMIACLMIAAAAWSAAANLHRFAR
jgi:hypothetical protein